MVPRSQFVAAVRALCGVPVRHRGRYPQYGLDCVGVPIAALAACGVAVDEVASYGLLPSEDILASGLSRYCREVAVSDRRVGDLLQVRMGRQARHVAVLTGHSELGAELIVHAMGKLHMVKETVLVPQDVVRVWRIKEVGDG